MEVAQQLGECVIVAVVAEAAEADGIRTEHDRRLAAPYNVIAVRTTGEGTGGQREVCDGTIVRDAVEFQMIGKLLDEFEDACLIDQNSWDG